MIFTAACQSTSATTALLFRTTPFAGMGKKSWEGESFLPFLSPALLIISYPDQDTAYCLKKPLAELASARVAAQVDVQRVEGRSSRVPPSTELSCSRPCTEVMGWVHGGAQAGCTCCDGDNRKDKSGINSIKWRRGILIKLEHFLAKIVS